MRTASKYDLYLTWHSTICRLAKGIFTKKQRSRKNFFDMAVECLEPKSITNIDLMLWAMEEEHIRRGNRCIFVEDLKLVEMLGGATMEIEPDNITADPKTPQLFSIAWPAGCREIGISPCLVYIGTRGGFTKIRKNHLKSMKIPESELDGFDSHLHDEDLFVAVFISYNETSNWERGQYLASCIPVDRIKASIESTASMKEALPVISSNRDLTLSERERESEFLTLRAVLRLVVYMRACPWLVRDGFPAGAPVVPKYMSFVPSRVGLPPHDRNSPEVHWRTWHFRQYPKRKDGTRKAGVVFVNGTVVGVKVDPESVRSE